jgi:hypothetical protein
MLWSNLNLGQLGKYVMENFNNYLYYTGQCMFVRFVKSELISGAS